jgi:integrase
VIAEVQVGQSRERVGGDGRSRWTAYFTDVTGARRSAGTFSTEKQADRAWQRAEARVFEGRATDHRRGRQSFRQYVTQIWFPNHRIELSTRQNYRYNLDRFILPEFGGYALNAIQSVDIRAWVTRLEREGTKASTIKYCLSILSAIFTTALNDQLVGMHPCKGVKGPTIASKTRRIVTSEQFDAIQRGIDDPTFRLLVETDVETGLRWGELTELRKRDIDWDSGVVTVSRVVVELARSFAPDGQRFVVKPYPKDDEWRRITLSAHVLGLLRDHATHLNDDDLLFPVRQPSAPRRRRPATLPNPATLGMTAPNEKGRRYPHGTITAYGMAPCRCQHCKDAYAEYRASRRARGVDSPRGLRTLDTDGHIPRAWFRTTIWLPALRSAGIPFKVRTHDLRHAHASWLLAGGADLATVKERMGHARLTTTEIYLHSLPHADAAAVAAIDSIRRRPTSQ